MTENKPAFVFSKTNTGLFPVALPDYCGVLTLFRRTDVLGGTGMVVREPGQSSVEFSFE
ncbi:hypothetical protein [Cryobacterium psychrophilum]|uniref:hypothetical protein n=1 Tax=Cryobacterium psychrophilum TaxID=41988 RepID=UPI0014170FD0|nr:hypothetical protein [Cryobacterium psychrophilum]